MSGRHQPENGADSAQSLADAIATVEKAGLATSMKGRGGPPSNAAGGPLLEPHGLGCRCWPHVSQSDAVKAVEHAALMEYRSKVSAILPRCIACSEPAVLGDVYCADHDSGEPPVRHPGLVDREPWAGGIADNE